MLAPLFPRSFDNTYRGHWLALVLLALYALAKILQTGNSILNARAVAMGADGIPLDAMDPASAGLVLRLFGLLSVSTVALILLSIVALLRYRSMAPLVFLLWIADSLARRGVAMLNPVERPEGAATPIGFYINLGMLAVLFVGLALSLWRRKPDAAAP